MSCIRVDNNRVSSETLIKVMQKHKVLVTRHLSTINETRQNGFLAVLMTRVIIERCDSSADYYHQDVRLQRMGQEK